MEKTGFTADETTTTGDGGTGISSFTNPRAASIAGLAVASASSGGMQWIWTRSSSLTLSSEALRFNDPVEAKDPSRERPSSSFLSIAMQLPNDSNEGLRENRLSVALLTKISGAERVLAIFCIRLLRIYMLAASWCSSASLYPSLPSTGAVFSAPFDALAIRSEF